MRVVWTDAALDDVAATFDYIARFNPFAARRIAEALVVAGDSLSTFPFRGRVGDLPSTRELAVVYPYVIVYRVRDDAVEVVRVWHGSQIRPG